MADEKKISKLTEVSTPTNLDEFVVVNKQGDPNAQDASDTGQTSKITLENLKNAIGSQGPKGDDGDPGDQGIQGAPGAPGVDGNDGAPGAPGGQGGQGIQGEPGAPGGQGIQGEPGAPGAPGAVGPMPNHQWSGNMVRFQNGIQNNGTPIYGNYSPSFKGEPGVQGDQGIQGEIGRTPSHVWVDNKIKFATSHNSDGTPNYGGILSPDLKGDPGAPGGQGIQGEPGAPGAPGAQGPAGPQLAGFFGGIASLPGGSKIMLNDTGISTNTMIVRSATTLAEHGVPADARLMIIYINHVGGSWPALSVFVYTAPVANYDTQGFDKRHECYRNISSKDQQTGSQFLCPIATDGSIIIRLEPNRTDTSDDPITVVASGWI